MKNAKLWFGSIIVVILLGLYAYSLLVAINLALYEPPPGGTLPELNPGVSRTLATVGGLVSALVIAVLAIAKPGESTAERVLADAAPGGEPPSERGIQIVSIVSVIYVLAWILLGVAAFVVGELLHPGKVQALTDFGQAWLGLAVAAAYAYFGLSR